MEYLTLACSIGALVISFFQINREGRSDLRAFLWHGYEWAKRVFGVVSLTMVFLFPTAVMVNSVYSFIRFERSNEPIARHEVVMLFLNFFNLVMYTSLLMIMIAVCVKAFKEWTAKKKGSPSMEGFSE